MELGDVLSAPQPVDPYYGYVKKLKHLLLEVRVWTDVNGQDLVEYALMSGFVAVAAGAIFPGISVNISKIFSSVASSMRKSASQGS